MTDHWMSLTQDQLDRLTRAHWEYLSNLMLGEEYHERAKEIYDKQVQKIREEKKR